MASDTKNVREMLMQQLSEITMLQSMFPKDGEFTLDDERMMVNMQAFIDGKIRYDTLKMRLGFILKLSFSKGELEVVCRLPHEYPHKVPDIYLRSSNLSRSRHRSLTNVLQAYLRGVVHRRELSMGCVVQWLQHHAEDYLEAQPVEDTHLTEELTTYSRMWILIHHIYSKTTRSNILQYCEELQLTGFCMPGKPSIICVEGYDGDTREFYLRVRKDILNKNISIKEKEEFEVKSQSEADSVRKFIDFEEKIFEPALGTGRKGHCAHSDRGQLFQFLEQIGCAHMFQIYFGLQGKGLDENSD